MAREITVPHALLMNWSTFKKHIDLRHPGKKYSKNGHNRSHEFRDDQFDHVHVIPEDLPYDSNHPDYKSNHYWVNKVRGPANRHLCAICSAPAEQWAWLELTHPDPYDIWSYAPMCRSCNERYEPTHDKRSASNSAQLRDEFGQFI